ncbi:MAG: hypothetical protein ACXACU_12255 [Candidatus Hodarchaeales archaeon]|jgi:hypothetical protein
MTMTFGNIEERLKEKYGERGVEYLAPQLDILRLARNLPSKLDDVRLMTQKFYESYQTILKWLAPVVVPITEEFSELEDQLRELQYQMKFIIQQEGIKFWNEIERSMNPNVQSQYIQILQARNYILKLRTRYLQAAHRHELSDLFSLVLWPYTDHTNWIDILDEVKKTYFGPNRYYSKDDIFNDALLLTALAEDCLTQRKHSSEANRQIESIIESRLTFRKVEEQFEWSKYKRDHNDGHFTEMQVNNIISQLLPGLELKIKSTVYQVYDDATDKYPIGKFLDWLRTTMRHRSSTTEDTSIQAEDSSTTTRHLIGLSFLDRHRRQEMLGNISGELSDTFEQILGPFHELKQQNAFMQSAQFEISNVMQLGSQAWIYDYSGIKTGILRSTLLLISDKQPKFDVLEACQQLTSSVLSGRVDRNDFKEGNYTVTDQLPSRMWKYVGKSLLTILEEALINEEANAVSLVKGIFRDEDRSKLVTSKKFIPVFLVKTDYKRGIDHYTRDKGLFPETISVWANEDSEFQYRFANLAGYPWFYEINELLESLVIKALNLPAHRISELHENVKLRQTVYKIDEEVYIVYYEHDLIDEQREAISALIFKETDILDEEGIDPVEVIFRPHKFLRMGPEKNNLQLVLDSARATDPKDLMTIISTMQIRGSL